MQAEGGLHFNGQIGQPGEEEKRSPGRRREEDCGGRIPGANINVSIFSLFGKENAFARLLYHFLLNKCYAKNLFSHLDCSTPKRRTRTKSAAST